MRHGGLVISGLMALGAFGCAGARGLERAPSTALAEASDATAATASASASDESSASGTASTTTTTLATAISGEGAKEEEPEVVPTTCGAEASIKDTKLCVPAPAYAKKLCGGIFPEVALGLFAKGTPWSRIYLAGDVEAWNASGGLTHRAKLAFDEEVIVLAKHAAGGSGGIVMTGAQASYDVLRWDGTCVSVMDGELTTKRPPAPKPAPIAWNRLEETTRRAFLANPKVKSARDDLGKVCGSIATPVDKAKCDKSEKAFAQALVEHVRTGGALPVPARRP